MANEIKKKHLQNNPDYSYQPRKPSEKKHRMTRHKAAVLAGMTDDLILPSSSVQVPSSLTASVVQSGPTNSAPISSTGTHYQQITLSTDELPFGFPDFERTEAGNAIVNIGDTDLSDTALSAMLNTYNTHQPAMVSPNLQHAVDLSSPVIYMEDDEVSASDKSYFKDLLDLDQLLKENRAAAAKIAALPDNAADDDAAWKSLTLTQQTALFDLNHADTFESELNMMKTMFVGEVSKKELSGQGSVGQDSVVANTIQEDSNVQVANAEDGFEQDTVFEDHLLDGNFTLP